MQLQEAPGCHLLEQSRELVLPLVAVLHQRELEIRAVQQHKLDIEDCLLLLHVISNLGVAERPIFLLRCFFFADMTNTADTALMLVQVFIPYHPDLCSSSKAFSDSKVSLISVPLRHTAVIMSFSQPLYTG